MTSTDTIDFNATPLSPADQPTDVLPCDEDAAARAEELRRFKRNLEEFWVVHGEPVG